MADVELHGPIFDARAKAAVNAMLNDAADAIAQRAQNDVRGTIRSRAVRRTGRYERHVQIERQGNDRQVNDHGMVYGPWLEGVSRRNFSTRFRGFAQFRRATQKLAGRTGEIAEPAVRRNIGRLQ